MSETEVITGGKVKEVDALLFTAGINKMFVPSNVKIYYKYAEWFYSHTAVGTVINKMARFPLANISTRSKNADAEQKAKRTIRRINLIQRLVKYGRNYFLYGLGVAVPMQPINKVLTCRACGKTYNVKDLERNGKPLYYYYDGKFQFKCRARKCPKRGVTAAFRVTDRRIKDVNKLSIAIWDPNLITCTHNEIADIKQWKYNVSNEMKAKITEKDHFILSTVPQMYLKAAHRSQSIKMHDDRIFVMEAPTLTIKGMPVPPMVMVFQELLLKDKYNRANRAIANNLLLTLRMLFPIHKNESGMRPLTDTLRLADWKDKVQSEIALWEKDNSHIVVLPVEIGSKDVWGQGKLLAVHSELRANMGDILSAFDMPIEFMYGGATWSRQNTSAIVLENTFKQYAAQLQEILDNVSEYINKSYSDESNNIEITLTSPRLVEALSELTFIERRYEDGEVSPQTYFGKLGMDARKEFARGEATKLSREAVAVTSARRMALAQVETEDVLMKSRKKIREVERIEGLKDNLANIAIKRDDHRSNIEMQKELSKLDLEVQKKMALANKKIQDIQARDEIQNNLTLMREGLKLQTKADYQQAKKMQKLQLKGMKDEAVVQEEIGIDAEQRQKERELSEVYSGLDAKVQMAIDKLPPEEKEAKLMELSDIMKKEQLVESMSPDEREEFDGMSDQEKEIRLQELLEEEASRQQTEMQIANDEKLQKDMLEKDIEKADEEANMMDQAKVYNQLYGEDRKQFQDELMRESSEKFTKVKQLADYLKTYEYVRQILDAGPQDAENIYNQIAIKDPELQEDVMAAVEDQIALQQQAQGYAMRLIQTTGTKEQEKLLGNLRSQAPEEFRRMVFNSYEIFVNMKEDQRRVKPLTKEQRQKRMIIEMIEKLKSHPKEMREEIMNSLSYENKDLYNKIKGSMEE